MMASRIFGRLRIPATPALAAFAAVLGLPTGAFSAQWLQDGREPPLHPTIITTDYKGRIYPVTAVSAEVPEIVVEGKTRKLNSDQSYQTPRALGYAPGYVTFRAQNASSRITTGAVRMMGGASTGGLFPSGTSSESGTYECTVVSAGALSGCYVAVLFFRVDATGSPAAGTTAMAFREIGDLAAGRETKVTINSGYVIPPGQLGYYFPMIFSRGLEIRTDQSEGAAGYFRRGEMAAHAALLAHYRQENPASDRPASAYLRFQPELPPGVDPRSLPATINARFAVTETGEVDSIELDQVLDVKVDREIRRALNGWLFLPRLKKGYPVRSLIAVPLSFELAAP